MVISVHVILLVAALPYCPKPFDDNQLITTLDKISVAFDIADKVSGAIRKAKAQVWSSNAHRNINEKRYSQCLI